MKSIACIIRPSKLEAVKEKLGQNGIQGMTVTHVIGCGSQQGRTAQYRGNTYEVNLLPKVKLEFVVEDSMVEPTLAVIAAEAKTGEIGDGKIFISTIDNAVRIRTGDRGTDALS